MKITSKKYFLRGLFITAFLAKSLFASAQLVVDSVPTAAQIIATLQGAGVTITNLNINCHREAYGTFTAAGTNLGIPAGLLLTNGYATNAIGPNNYPTIASQCWNTISTDPNLTAIINTGTSGVKVVDACIMTFDITPTCDSIKLNFVFGSEEYPTYVGSYNDGFGFWISGPNPSGGNYNNSNIALVPGTATPISINNVNNGTTNTGPCTNCAYYLNNEGGLSIEYNGLTVPLTAYVHVVPCQTYSVEIGIADAGDCIYDSGVFIASPGFTCVDNTATTKVSPHDTTVCEGQSVPLVASGTGNYTWGPAAGLSATTGSNVTATPTVTTTYTVTGSNTTSCGTTTNSDSVTIVVETSSFAVTPISSSICVGDSVKIIASGTHSYVWSPATGLSSTTDSILYAKPTTTTTYTITGTSSLGCTSTETALVTVNPLPPVVANSSAICTGTSSTLTGSGAVTYSWSTGATSNSITINPITTTSYTLTGTDANGCTNSSVATVTVNPIPVLAISQISSQICIGDSSQINVSGANTYSWLPATGLSSTTDSIVYGSPITTTTYTITGLTSAGCSSTTTVSIVVNPLPIITITPSAPVVCPGDSVKLTASGAATYTWSPATGLSSTSGNVVYSKPGSTTSYTITGTSAAGCSATASTSVTIAPLPVLTISPSTPFICPGDSVQLTATGASTYAWLPPTGLSSTTDSIIYAKPTTTTSYTVIGTSSLGCPAVAVALVSVYPTPVVTINPSATVICQGDSSRLIASGAQTYNWLPNTGLSATTGDTVFAYPTTTTTYTLTAVDANGCAAAPVSVTIQVIPPLTVHVSAATPGVCAGAKDSLKSVVTGGGGIGYTYSWTPTTGLSNSTSANVNATLSTSTTYTLTVTDACGIATDTLTVGIYPNPVIDFTTDKKSGCTPVCIVFSDSSTISSGSIANWQWSFGNGKTSNARDTTYCYTSVGSYNIGMQEISDKGCVSTYNGVYTINADPLPVANFSYTPNPINILQPLVTFKDLSSGAISWQWNFGDTFGGEPVGTDTSNLENPTHTYQDTGTYCIKLTVMNLDSCYSSNEYCLVIQPDWAIYVPNAFTPNGDGLNDVFLPTGFGLDPDGYSMYIFDRWGNLIFETNNINQGWNGHANNGKNIAQEDVYVWKIVVKDVFGKSHQYIGHVTIVR